MILHGSQGVALGQYVQQPMILILLEKWKTLVTKLSDKTEHYGHKYAQDNMLVGGQDIDKYFPSKFFF